MLALAGICLLRHAARLQFMAHVKAITLLDLLDSLGLVTRIGPAWMIVRHSPDGPF